MVQYNVQDNIDNQCKKSQLLSLMQTIKGHRNIRRCGNSLASRWCCAYVYHWVKYIGSVKHRAFELMTKVVLCMFPLKRNCRVFFYIKGIAYKCSEIALRFEIQLLLENCFFLDMQDCFLEIDLKTECWGYTNFFIKTMSNRLVPLLPNNDTQIETQTGHCDNGHTISEC